MWSNISLPYIGATNKELLKLTVEQISNSSANLVRRTIKWSMLRNLVGLFYIPTFNTSKFWFPVFFLSNILLRVTVTTWERGLVQCSHLVQDRVQRSAVVWFRTRFSAVQSSGSGQGSIVSSTEHCNKTTRYTEGGNFPRRCSLLPDVTFRYEAYNTWPILYFSR
jgi:hypothetical protein